MEINKDLENEREVEYEEGAKQAEEWGFPFLEVSALTKEGIEDAFKQIVKMVYPAKLKALKEKEDSGRKTLKEGKKNKSTKEKT